jgi:hypothetical protein
MTTHNTTDMYRHYKKCGGKLSWELFRDLCYAFNLRAVEKLLEGQRIHMGYHLSYLQIVKAPTTYKRPRVDWPASNKRKEMLLAQGKTLYDKKTGKGEHWLVYMMQDEYYFYLWDKSFCQVKNHTVYKFKPSRGKVGAVGKLNKLLAEDPTASLNFHWAPL